MASEETIQRIFAALESVGIKHPVAWTTPEKVEEAIDIWCIVFSKLSDEEAMSACHAFISSPDCRWWPPPGVLLAHAPSTQLGDIDRADEAFGEVLGAVRRHGYYSPPHPVDAPLHPVPAEHDRMMAAVNAVGGWAYVCHSQTSDLGTIRAAFRNAYRSLAERTQIEERHGNVLQLLHGPKTMIGE